MISIEQSVETAFQPGNLVHGTELRLLPYLIDEGIRTGWRYESSSWTPHDVCFALLATHPLLDRYNEAYHRGPTIGVKDTSPRVSILVESARLLKRFPNDTKAVGTLFWSSEPYGDHRTDQLKCLYEYNPEDDSVFQIPIGRPDTAYQYPDEVRVHIDLRAKDSVEPDLWDGLVVQPDNLDRTLRVISQAQRKIYLPIFSPEAELLLVST